MHSSHPHCCAEHSCGQQQHPKWTVLKVESKPNLTTSTKPVLVPAKAKQVSVCPHTLQLPHPSPGDTRQVLGWREEHSTPLLLVWAEASAGLALCCSPRRADRASSKGHLYTWDGLYSAHQTISRPICHPLHTYRHGCARKSVSEPLQERAPHPALKCRYLSGLWILGSVSGFQARTVTASSNAQCGQRPHHLSTITISCHVWQMRTQRWLSNLHTLLGFHAVLLEQRSVSVWSKGEVKPK